VSVERSPLRLLVPPMNAPLCLWCHESIDDEHDRGMCFQIVFTIREAAQKRSRLAELSLA
jgi:hypothetical protein